MALLLAIAAASASGGTKTDFYGDPLPPGAVARMGTIRLRHEDAVFVFSADSKQLISCDPNGELRVWDAATGKLRRRQRLRRGDASPGSLHLNRDSPSYYDHIQWTPDGTLMAARCEKAIHFYDTATGESRGRFPLDFLGGKDAGSESLTYLLSKDGKLLTALRYLEDKPGVDLYVWDIAANRLRQTRKYDLPVTICSPDGKYLAGWHKFKELRLWDVASGKESGRREVSRLGGAVFSPDGQTIVTGLVTEKGRGVQLLDAATLKQKGVLELRGDTEKEGYFYHFTFSPDGRLLAAAHDNSRGNESNRGIAVWDLTGEKKALRLPQPRCGLLAFSGDGRTLACDWGAEIRLWDLTTGRLRLQRPGHASQVNALSVSPDGRILASGAGEIHLWNAATGQPLRELQGSCHFLRTCLFSSDGQRLIAAGKVDNFRECVEIWDVAHGKRLRQFLLAVRFPFSASEDSRIQAIGSSADGNRLTAAYWNHKAQSIQFLLWDTNTGKELSSRSDKKAAFAALTPDGEFAMAWWTKEMTLVEVSTGRRIKTFPEEIGFPMNFSPEGRYAAMTIWKRKPKSDYRAEWKGISLIETASWEEALLLQTGHAHKVAFTPDGRGLAVMEEKALRIWDTITGELLYQLPWPANLKLKRPEPEITSLTLLPGGRAATGMRDGTVLIWDLAIKTWPVDRLNRRLAPAELDTLWTDLAGRADKAHRALRTLCAASRQSLPFLAERLPRVSAEEAKQNAKLLADLDSDSFQARQAASRELARLHYRVEPMLRRKLRGQPSLDLRRRIETILAGPKQPLADDLRLLRAIAVLERIGSPEARAVLEKLSKGAPSRATHEAQAALQRLKRR